MFMVNWLKNGIKQGLNFCNNKVANKLSQIFNKINLSGNFTIANLLSCHTN